jgi:UPF0716 protein FxsA
MNRPPLVFLAILAWLSIELAAFMAVVNEIGFVGALFLGFLTSMAGFALLRRSGVGALAHLQRAAAGGQPPQGAMLDGLLGAIAALLLILPGFASDLVGLALAAPSVRQILAGRFGGVSHPGRRPSRSPRHPEIIDLAPGEWASHDGAPESART